MKIRITTKRYVQLRTNIRDRAEANEWKTWTTVRRYTDDNGYFRRLVHVPENDDQFRCIELSLRNPAESDINNGDYYLDIVPVKSADSDIDNDEFKNKSAIVLGRFCEILNRYFPALSGYRVILK